jgi:hypothetical protein
MKSKLTKIARYWATIFVLPFFALSSVGQAEEAGALGVGDASIAVDVIVNIDQDARAITLKNDEGGEWVFLAGPEVRNFDQLERGDLVLMAYYSGLAIALEPKGSGLEERISELKVERAAPGEKPGMNITDSTFVAAEVTAVNAKERTVTLQGAKGSLILKAGHDVDLSQIAVGQEVEALYTQTYAVSVVPAPKVSGTVSMKIKAVALGIGVEWGEGTLTMYDGTSHAFKATGLTLLDVGISGVEAKGEVYNLVEAKDLEGTFLVGEAGAALVGGGSASVMKNKHGVVMKLKSTQEGVRLTLAGEGLKITLK